MIIGEYPKILTPSLSRTGKKPFGSGLFNSEQISLFPEESETKIETYEEGEKAYSSLGLLVEIKGVHKVNAKMYYYDVLCLTTGKTEQLMQHELEKLDY